MGLFSFRKSKVGKVKVRRVSLDLTYHEALELAGYLDGTDMHLSIGDRLTLSRRLKNLVKEEQ